MAIMAIFIPLGIGLAWFYGKYITQVIFYNRITGEWKHIKKSTYYLVRIGISLIFLALVFPMIWVGTYKNIDAFIRLKQGKEVYIDFPSESKKMSEKVQDEDFIQVFKTDIQMSPKRIGKEIIPQILEKQGKIRKIYSLPRYSIRYENGEYLILAEGKIPAKFEVKLTLFFKEIHFYGYYKVYEALNSESYPEEKVEDTKRFDIYIKTR